uniref:Uncharacterized protein n=1 Tax=Glossina austeni TaxID=7395 RepID=A0A1A9V1D2_GLOAU
MVLNETSLCAGMMIRNLLTGYICEAANAITVFSISSTLWFLAVLHVYVESVKPEQIMTAGNSKIREFFRLDSVKDLVRTCPKRRPNYYLVNNGLNFSFILFICNGDLRYFPDFRIDSKLKITKQRAAKYYFEASKLNPAIGMTQSHLPHLVLFYKMFWLRHFCNLNTEGEGEENIDKNINELDERKSVAIKPTKQEIKLESSIN